MFPKLRDTYIKKVVAILNLPEYRNGQPIPSHAISTLQAAKQPVYSITPRLSVKKTAKFPLGDQHIQEWNNTLDHLTVQSKFKDVVIVVEENKTWNHLLT